MTKLDRLLLLLLEDEEVGYSEWGTRGKTVPEMDPECDSRVVVLPWMKEPDIEPEFEER